MENFLTALLRRVETANMGNFLTDLLRRLEPAIVTEYFLYFIIALFLISALLSRFGKCNRLVANTPNLLTSIGILGTFTGIVIGLTEFKVSDIDGSIDGLLEGLKTAFITSLVGIFGSIWFKVLSSTPWRSSSSQGARAEDIGPALLKAIQRQGDQLESLHTAIAGDEESSLAGQIKLFRNDARDNHVAFTKELWVRLTNFAEMLSTSATEQVINALKEVIKDFNTNLTEQFGENFKALDAAVHRLVEWQENYRTQLEQMSQQYKQGVEAITQTELSVARISKESEKIPQVMDALQVVMEVNQHQITELGRHLEAFTEVRDKAVEAVPELQRQVEETVTGISNATQQLVTGMNESAESLSTNTEQIRDQLVNMTEVLEQTGTEVQKGAQAIQQEVANSITQMQTYLESVLTGVVQTTQDKVNAQLETIDIAMTEEIERTMKSMGQALVSITEKFTKDYTRLVKEMDKIVRQRGDRN